VQTLWAIHRWLYRISGGRIGGRLAGRPVLLLTVHGRKSGKERTVALNYFRAANLTYVLASNAGEPNHPAWYLNLKDSGPAWVQIGSQRHPVRMRVASGDERQRLWAGAVEQDPSYEVYRRRTERAIPVVILDETTTAV
jgi:deazaflavin-dependent oxidoreductase (nitroreductase family)